MEVPREVTKVDVRTKMNAGKQFKCGLRRLTDKLMMATIGLSTARKTSSKQSISVAWKTHILASPLSSASGNPCKLLLLLGLFIYFVFIFFPSHYPNFTTSDFFSPSERRSPMSERSAPMIHESPTNLSHLVFAILGSEKALHRRRSYIESWWRPNVTRGLLYLDKAPTGDLLPWSNASPPYRVYDDLTKFLQETKPLVPRMIRMVHGIIEVLRDVNAHDELRWLVMGDDDSIFFVDNIVDVLGQYDHRKYYYIGGKSEFILSNYWFSFNQGFGGGGFMLSYPLAKALADGMENCLRKTSQLISADLIIMVCIADLGVNLSPQQGIHQIDLIGDISGFLSSHPNSPLMSLHHFDIVRPIFPQMNRTESTRHLMKAAAADQSRMLQQTICHHRESNWSFSISWGYSAHIYERIMPRSYLQRAIETFKPWVKDSGPRPFYMFDTRLQSNDSCETPHVFFFRKVKKGSARIITTYTRVVARGLSSCLSGGSRSADFISEISVLSPRTRRKEIDRCECCDIISIKDAKAKLKFRECKMNEIVA